MADDPRDAFEEARRESEKTEPGSGEDQRQAESDDAERRAADEETRMRILGDLLTAARGLKPGDNPDKLVRQACHARLTSSQVDTLLKEIAATTKATLKSLREDLAGIAKQVAADAAQRRQEEAARQDAAADKKAAGNPKLIEANATYPLPLHGTRYNIHEGRVWAGRFTDNDIGTTRVFSPLHTPFSIDGQIYYPPNDVEGLRVSVQSSKGIRCSVYVRLGRLQDSRGATEAMSAMADAGLRVSKKGREAILEILSTSFHRTVIAGLEHAGFCSVDGRRIRIGCDGSLV